MTTTRFVWLLPITLLLAPSAFADSSSAASDSERIALANYRPDVFRPRQVEACSMTHVLGELPVNGGRVWLFGGQGDTIEVACDRMPKLTTSPLPRSILRDTEMEGCTLSADSRLPESVQLREGIPNRVVQAWAIRHKGKVSTEAPCQELDSDVICEGSENAEFVTATRKLESVVQTAEGLVAQKKFESVKAILSLASELAKVANAGQSRMSADAIVKTSEATHQTKKDFEKRINSDMKRAMAAINAYIAAAKAANGTH